MLLQIILAILAGCLLGTITGITPGLHINLAAAIIFSLSPLLLQHFSPLFIAAMIVAMSFTHTFTDFIPSIFLGAPASDTALSALPGHRLLLEGRGFQALVMTTTGSFLGLILIILMSPLLLATVSIIFKALQKHIGIMLTLLIILMVLREKETKKRIWALTVIILSGILGLAALNSSIKEPLLPLLSGLFGVSMLLLSIKNKTSIPPQTTGAELPDKKELLKTVLAGTFSGGIVSIFPAVGPAQAAIVGEQLMGKLNNHTYLIMTGSINTVSMFLSLITLYTIHKARNGSIAIMSELITVDASTLLILCLIALISGAIAAVITLKTGKIFILLINRINYTKLCIAIIALITLLVLKFSGTTGTLILTAATIIGIIPNIKQISRSHAMGCLIVPVIGYYL